jgi:hypothetical protein
MLFDLKITPGEEADKTASDFTASIASIYRLSTRKITFSDLNQDSPALESRLNHKWKLMKLWPVTRDPARKTAVNWATKTIRRMTCRQALERRETKVRNSEVTPQALLPIAKWVTKRDGTKAPTAVLRL